jgi:crotonobetainyl-CoA:carnitine CoA-transferase CaiB-like acyl-CoA transferase
VVDVSLFETAASWMTLIAAQYCASGQLPRRMGSGQGGIVPYRAFRTADGDLMVAAPNNALFRKLCGLLGRPEWAEDERFRQNADRVRSAAALNELIDGEMAGRTNAQWMAAFEAAGVPCAPVQNVAQMLGHAQLEALGLLQPVPGLAIPLMGLPLSFDGERPGPGRAAPRLGEHTKDVL